MQSIKKILMGTITSARLDGQLGQITSYGGAVGILLHGMRKLTTLVVTEAELFFGLLLVLTVSLLMVILGTMLAPGKSCGDRP